MRYAVIQNYARYGFEVEFWEKSLGRSELVQKQVKGDWASALELAKSWSDSVYRRECGQSLREVA